MANPKLGTAANGEPMHYSAGALIKRDNKYLLIDRATPPPGLAGVAGHIDEGETPEQALIREVPEESGLTVTKYKLIIQEERPGNWCRRGINTHYWYLFDCEVSGEINRSLRETKSIGWYSRDEIKKFHRQNRLEPIWEYWFKKLEII